MDIGAWLRGLGLERYERAFQDGAIDSEVLPELTDEHLRELGLPLGHRLKLLKAIAALRNGSSQPPGPHSRAPPLPVSSRPVQRRRARRQVSRVHRAVAQSQVSQPYWS